MNCWKTLGIDPTADDREIRRAYASRLKTIDVDKDPEAFIALRQAFEAARYEAQWIGREDAGDLNWDDDDFALADDMPVQSEVAYAVPGESFCDAQDTAPQRPQPWATNSEIYNARAQALGALLFERPEDAPAWPNEAETAEMLDHWQVIASDPRMQDMSFYPDAEQWAAEVVARACPFSDPLVRPVSDYFRWLAAAGEISQSPAVAWVVQRRQALFFLEAIRDPKHNLHAAYQELMRPATETSRRGWVNKSKVRTLLATVRTHFPDLEGVFDYYRVALWDGTAAQGGGWSPWSFLWIFWVLLLFARTCSESTPSQAPPLPVSVMAPVELADQRADINTLLGEIGDGSLTEAQVAAKNPMLAQLLRSNWEIARTEGRNRDQYIESMTALLNERAAGQIRVAPEPVRLEYQQIIIDEAKALRKWGAGQCADFFRGKEISVRSIPSDITSRRRALTSRTLLETRSEPLPARGERTYNIPGPIFAAATKRAGLPEKQMQDALLDKGTDQNICTARIALREEALARRDEASAKRLLREM